MIIAKLSGGLGNQMFQYAFGRRLSLKNNTPLKLDVSELSMPLKGEYTPREYGLNVFSINASIAQEDELKKYSKTKFEKIIDFSLLHLPININKLYVREPYFHFFKRALKAPKDSYLDGYWQSEKYFTEIRNTLLNDYSLSAEVSEKTAQLAKEIQNCNSVSIHVRRGDYISIASNSGLYEVCDVKYFMTAMDKISAVISNPKFYIFSDDSEWFRQNVKTNYLVEFVTHNSGKDSFQDIYLMSLCKHNIIANSSFSWWGAWLNKNPQKCVIAPERWFKSNSKDSRDLIPETWIKV